MQLVGPSRKMEEQNVPCLTVCGAFTVGCAPGAARSTFAVVIEVLVETWLCSDKFCRSEHFKVSKTSLRPFHL